MSKLQSWVYAFRLRTLPLAFSSIITGSAIAFAENRNGFSVYIFAMCLLTTLLLQILSNLANDYGDSIKGTDNDERIGPKRAVQQGLLSLNEMKAGIVLTSVLCLITGSILVYDATLYLHPSMGMFFFVLGLGAIMAAVKYTVGEKAYGYIGLGDMFVFLFFGLVGVLGSNYLLAHRFCLSNIFPAVTMGLFATGVLNLNNLRDMETDAKAGKKTLVVRMGTPLATKYHTLLICVALLSSVVYVILNFSSTIQLLFIITLPLFRKHLVAVWRVRNAKDFDPLLKQLAIATFIFSILFAVGIIAGSAE